MTRSVPARTWVGLLIVLASQAATFAGIEPFRTWHTPVAWTGYILCVDGIVWKRRGHSWLSDSRAEFFFAPQRLGVRSRDWGAAELQARIGAAMASFVTWTEGWLRVERASGPDETLAAYLAVLDGSTPPDVARVASLGG